MLTGQRRQASELCAPSMRVCGLFVRFVFELLAYVIQDYNPIVG